MLILTRRVGETLMIGDSFTVTVLEYALERADWERQETERVGGES